MELEVMVHNGVSNVIQFEKVLESPRRFLKFCLDVIHVDWVDVNGRAKITPKETG